MKQYIFYNLTYIYTYIYKEPELLLLKKWNKRWVSLVCPHQSPGFWLGLVVTMWSHEESQPLSLALVEKMFVWKRVGWKFGNHGLTRRKFGGFLRGEKYFRGKKKSSNHHHHHHHPRTPSFFMDFSRVISLCFWLGGLGKWYPSVDTSRDTSHLFDVASRRLCSQHFLPANECFLCKRRLRKMHRSFL